jgi:selenocysteine-specific elongation factor
MSAVQHFILATAGHVDHGKSALVKALTGTDPDRLPEEKARGITIDLGFAHLKLSSSGQNLRGLQVQPTPDPASFMLGIVDVPGHEDFVKNMVAGVGSVDLALLVVAADDGWMPQTEEHLEILTYLGVRHAVVALTKIDLTHDEPAAIDAIRHKLGETPFADAPIVPTSIVSGRGLDDLKATLAKVVAGLPEPRDFGKPRLPVDRVFTLQGIGTVVTGTLTGGALRRGQSVIIQPSGKAARIRNMQCANSNVEVSGPGTRTALNLSDLAAVEDIARGNVVTLREFGGPSNTFDALIQISPRANRSLKEGTRVRVHYGSGNVVARVAFFEKRGELATGESVLAQLRLESQAFAFAGDRCILRDWAEQNTLAGAIVLDPDARRRGFRDAARLECLRQRAQAPDDVVVLLASLLTRDGAARKSELLTKSRFSDQEIAAGVARLAQEGKIVLAGNILIDAQRWRAARERAVAAIDERHRKRPEQVGLPLAELRTVLAKDLPHDESFDALIADLCKVDFVRAGAEIRRRAHSPALPTGLQAAGTKLRAALGAKPFDPPSRSHLISDAASQQALRFLVHTGEAIELSEDVVMTAENVARAAALIRQFIRTHGPATVSDLRQALGSSRRVVVPLLERLDRDGVTSRQGEKRVLRG